MENRWAWDRDMGIWNQVGEEILAGVQVRVDRSSVQGGSSEGVGNGWILSVS